MIYLLFFWYFKQGGKVYRGSTAIIEMANHLKFPYPLLKLFRPIPECVRNLAYDFVSQRRYSWFGKFESEKCTRPSKSLRQKLVT